VIFNRSIVNKSVIVVIRLDGHTFPDADDGTFRVMEDVMRDAAEQRASDLAVTPRSRDDHVGIDVLRDLHHHLPRLARHDHEPTLDLGQNKGVKVKGHLD
jgi:hypothetical protein